MTITVAPTKIGHRPAAVVTTGGVLVFLGISALAGGIAMVLGMGAAPPETWLDEIPAIDNWVLPGLVLGIGFGAGSLVAAYGMLRRPRFGWLGSVEQLTRHHWSWIATILIGPGHVDWIDRANLSTRTVRASGRLRRCRCRAATAADAPGRAPIPSAQSHPQAAPVAWRGRHEVRNETLAHLA